MEKKNCLSHNNCNALIALFALLSFASCSPKKHIEFPDDTPGNRQPLIKPLVFSQSQPLRWKEISRDSIQPSKTFSLDIEKLPAKFFSVNDFKPFKNPIVPKQLDWENIPDSTVNFDTVATMPFKMRLSILPKPVITKAGMPKLMPNTTSGVLQFSEEEGLPGTAINASLVDDDGMVWLSTNKGLCMYTGEFLYKYTITNNTPEGSNFLITSMKKDKAGIIWMTTAGDGIYAMDIGKGILYHHHAPQFAIDIVKSYDDIIWVAGIYNNRGTLYIIDTKKQTLKKIPDLDICIQIKEDKYHNIWMGNYSDISIISPDRKKIKKLSQKYGLDIQVAFKLFEDSNGDMWVGSNAREINIISLKNKTISTINAHNGFTGMAVEIAEDRQGKIWAIMKDTMCVINKERTAFKNINAYISMAQQLKGTALTDTHGNIWIGSLDKGAVIIDPEGPLPEHLDRKNGLSDNNVWGVMEAKDGTIWMATYDGINIYNPLKNEMRLLGKELGVGSTRVSRITEYNEDTIIAITLTGFHIIDRRRNIISNYSTNFLRNINVLNCTKDEQKRLWMGGINGLLQLDLHTGSAKLFNRALGFTSDLIWATATDRAGNIWVGTDKGLAVINPVNNTVKYLGETEGLCNNTVMKIVAKENDEIWVATQKGIAVVDIRNNTITNLAAKEGLVPDAIYDLLEGTGGMYAGSSDGMIFITKPNSTTGKNDKWSFVNYGKKEGFPFNDFNQNAGAATLNGQLWWGITPVLSIVTQPLVKDTIAPVVNISAINIMDATPSFFSYKELGRQLKNGTLNTI